MKKKSNKNKKTSAAKAKKNPTTHMPKEIVDQMHKEHTKQASQPTAIQGEDSAAYAIFELGKFAHSLNIRRDVAAYCLVYLARILIPGELETMQSIIAETEEDTATLRQQLAQRHESQQRIISDSLPTERVRVKAYAAENQPDDRSANILREVAETIASNHDDAEGLIKELYEVFAERNTPHVMAAYSMFLAGRMLLRRNPLMEGATLYAAQCAAGEVVLPSRPTEEDEPAAKKEGTN